jgi:hypothetical protein
MEEPFHKPGRFKPKVRFQIAARTLCAINQPVRCVTPSVRAISHELMPFFAFTISHTHGSHFSSPSALSSKIVPTFAPCPFRLAETNLFYVNKKRFPSHLKNRPR